MKREIELLPPMMPNFISIKSEPRPRQEGIQLGNKIPITDLGEKEAEEYGELMKQSFINHWKLRKKSNQTP